MKLPRCVVCKRPVLRPQSFGGKVKVAVCAQDCEPKKRAA